MELQALQSLAELPASQTETLEFNNTQRVLPYPRDLLWKREDGAHGFARQLSSAEGVSGLKCSDLSC